MLQHAECDESWVDVSIVAACLESGTGVVSCMCGDAGVSVWIGRPIPSVTCSPHTPLLALSSGPVDLR